jgi:transposase InsO family protein
VQIRDLHEANRKVYGSPRIYNALRERGIRCGKHRVAKIMRCEGLQGRSKRRFRSTATVRAELPSAPNRLERNFHSEGLNRIWVGDITQIRTGQGWLFLAVLLDLFSRKVVGYATASHAHQDLALDALARAIRSRKPPPGLVHHTDRGGQYGSAEYQCQLDRHGMICSMNRAGKCVDNAVAESFFHTLKTEWLYHFRFSTREQARLATFDYIEGFYNRTRLHFTLGYRSPDEYEKMSAVA